MSLSCYIAAPWAHQAEAKAARELFQAAGFTVTARWLDSEDTHDPDTLRECARTDIEDIYHSQVFVLLNSQARGAETSGKAVETGIALTLGLPILAVGEKSNVFHHLEHPMFFTWVATVEDAVSKLQDWEAEIVMDRAKEESKVSGVIIPGGVQ